MRIAVLNWSRRKVGGVETYLSGIIPELFRIGHAVAFWHEVDEPASREQIALPDGVPTWCVSDLGAERALSALRNWRPDLIYAHRFLDQKLEAETLKVAPAIFYAHDYHGTCISGAKTFKNPVVTPCSRRFGWQCLLHYYPHRCGGLSPVTMLRQYRRQSKALELLSGYKAVLTNSDHMRTEYIKHGLPAERVYYHVDRAGQGCHSDDDFQQLNPTSLTIRSSATDSDPLTETTLKILRWRLLFLGRMEFLKGGRTFLDALPQVRASLDRPLLVVFAGDGPDRQAWEHEAARLQAEDHELCIKFVGWLDNQQRKSFLADCDLLVVPSLWPEPFGLVGPEAGTYGKPVVAFAVGGIPEWLTDEVSGYLAPGDPPTAVGLAGAIIKCLHDPATHARLRRGATEMAQRFNVENHLVKLLEVFEKVVHCK